MPTASISCRSIGTSWMSSGLPFSSSSTSLVAERRTRMAAEIHSEAEEDSPGTIAVPAPTAWPMVLAFGVLLTFAGLATSVAISLLGIIAALTGMIGWFRDVLPREARESVRKEPQPPAALTARREVVHLHIVRDSRRARLPVEIY